MTLKNITTVTENKKLDAKQTKYIILEDMGSHNFEFDTPPGIRNVFHVDRLRAVSMVHFFSQISDDNHPEPFIVNEKTPEYDVERILKKKKRSRGYQYLVKWKNYARPTWEPISTMENTVAFDEFELKKTNLN